MATQARFETIATRHADQREALILKLIKLLLGIWGSVSYPDDATITAGNAARSASAVSTAVAQMRRLERSYGTAVFREFGISTRDLPTPFDAYPRANVTPLEVYQRPVDQFIWERRNGKTATETRDAFTQRMTDLAEADVMTASRDEIATLYDSRDDISGYRRIIHPELSKSGTCGLCIAASARVYHSADLMPLHGGTCNCTTLPIRGEDDPGHRITEDDLQRLYAAAGTTAAADLQNTRIRTVVHGELGPMLVKQGDHFRTPEEAGRPPYVRPDREAAATIRAREVDLLGSLIPEARTAFDDFVSSHPRDSWTAAEQQRAHLLQRAELDLAARLRQLQAIA